MSAAIAYTRVYQKRAEKVLSPEERGAMELHVADNPEIHPVVAGTGGVRKARWGRQGKGKRGGVRIIYFYRSARRKTRRSCHSEPFAVILSGAKDLGIFAQGKLREESPHFTNQAIPRFFVGRRGDLLRMTSVEK